MVGAQGAKIRAARNAVVKYLRKPAKDLSSDCHRVSVADVDSAIRVVCVLNYSRYEISAVRHAVIEYLKTRGDLEEEECSPKDESNLGADLPAPRMTPITKYRTVFQQIYEPIYELVLTPETSDTGEIGAVITPRAAARSADGEEFCSTVSPSPATPSPKSGASTSSTPFIYPLSGRADLSTSSNTTAITGTVPNKGLKPTAAQASSIDRQNQVYSHSGCSSSIPTKAFNDFQFQDKRCTGTTNWLCKWLATNASKHADLQSLGIRTFENKSKFVYEKFQFCVTPISSLKTMALIIERHGITLSKELLDEVKWMVEYRRAKSACFLREPTQRDSEVDEDTKAHEYANNIFQDVYKILSRVTPRRRETVAQICTEGDEVSKDPCAEVEVDTKNDQSTGQRTPAASLICTEASAESSKTSATHATDRKEPRPIQKAASRSNQPNRERWVRPSDFELIPSKSDPSRAMVFQMHLNRLNEFLVEAAKDSNNLKDRYSLRLEDEQGTDGAVKPRWIYQIKLISDVLYMARIVQKKGTRIDEAFLEVMEELLTMQIENTFRHDYHAYEHDSPVEINLYHRSLNETLHWVLAILRHLPRTV